MYHHIEDLLKVLDHTDSEMIVTNHSPRPRTHDFPNTNITNRMMNVELSYDLASDLLQKMVTERTLDVNDREAVCSASPGPAALFMGNSVERRSALVEFRMTELPRYASELIFSPLFDALKQLTGFRTVTLRLSVLRPSSCSPPWMEVSA